MRVLPSLSFSSSQCPNPLMASGSVSLMWFRKGLRIHDNPALEYAAKGTEFLYPVFVIDPHYMEPDPNAFSPGSTRAGLNRIRFLLESLVDLDLSLKKLGSRLLVLKGEPSEVLIRCLKEVTLSLSFAPPLLKTQKPTLPIYTLALLVYVSFSFFTAVGYQEVLFWVWHRPILPSFRPQS